MSTGADAAFEVFHELVDRARPLVDGCVPIAMLFVPSHEIDGQEAMTDIEVDRGVRVVWAAELSSAARRQILAQLAEPESTEIRG